MNGNLSSNFSKASKTIGRGIAMIMALIVVATLFTGANIAQAQDSWDPGEGEFGHDMMLPWRVGSFHYERGNFERALPYFEEAAANMPERVLEFDPNYAEIYFFIGATYTALGDEEAADAHFDLYLSYLPDHAEYVEAIIVGEIVS